MAGRWASVTASGDTSPNPTGSWALTDTYDNVPPDSPYRTGYDTVTFTPTSPGVYTITNATANGGGSSGVPVSGDSFTYEVCGASAGGAVYPEGDCPAGSGYFMESWEFDYTGSTYTATGSFQQYAADGSTADLQYGTFTATGPAGSAEPSATTVKCATADDATQCTATVSDAGSAGLTPTGSVTFNASAGSFATETCTLQAAAVGATCSADYTEPSSGSPTSTPVTVTASYGGDDKFSGSSGVTTLTYVSGTMTGDDCDAESCDPSPLAGITILVEGKANDGSVVDQTDVTDEDGDWSVQVPAGSYTVGPVGEDGDDDKFVGASVIPDPPTAPAAEADAVEVAHRDGRETSPAAEPGTIAVRVGTSDLPDLDFSACDGAVAASSAGASRSSGSRVADRSGPSRARDATVKAFTPTMCVSSYTLTIAAKIPQKILVDPSPEANFVVGSNPTVGVYRTHDNFGAENSTGGQVIGKEYWPACMPLGKAEAYAAGGGQAQWYSYVDGDTSLGKVSIPIAWNQDHQSTDLAGVPVETLGTLTREFRWRVNFSGRKSIYGQCPETAHVPLMVWPVAGGDGAQTKLRNNEFTIVAAWWLPFDAPGLIGTPESNDAEKIVDAGLKSVQGLYEAYEKFPAKARFVLEFGVGLLLGTGEVRAIEEGGPWVARLLAGWVGPYLSESAVTKLEWAASVGEYYHWLPLAAERLHQLTVVRELIGLYTGYHGYPIMSAVIRGKFSTPDSTVNKAANQEIPDSSMLAVSVKSTNFPNISLKITRNALDVTNNVPVFHGSLPWNTALSGNPETWNPLSSKFPANFISDSAKTGHSYASGATAVANYKSDTAQLPEVAYSLDHYGNLASNFGAEEGEADDPECDAAGFKEAGSTITTQTQTICWFFTDGRP